MSGDLKQAQQIMASFWDYCEQNDRPILFKQQQGDVIYSLSLTWIDADQNMAQFEIKFQEEYPLYHFVGDGKLTITGNTISEFVFEDRYGDGFNPSPHDILSIFFDSYPSQN